MTGYTIIRVVIAAVMVMVATAHTLLRRSLYRHVASHYPDLWAEVGRPNWFFDMTGRRAAYVLLRKLRERDKDMATYYRQWLIITEVIVFILAISVATTGYWWPR